MASSVAVSQHAPTWHHRHENCGGDDVTDDYLDNLTQDIRRRRLDSPKDHRVRTVTIRLRRYAIGGWMWRYLGLLIRNFLAPTLALAGILALAEGIAGWNYVPSQVWLIPPAVGFFLAGAYSYRDKPPRMMTAGELIIARRNIKRHIAELERENQAILKQAEEDPDLRMKRDDINHLLGHCEFVCRDIGSIDPSSADALRDAASRVDQDIYGDVRYGAVIFPTGSAPKALLVGRNLRSWIIAAHEITDALAPARQQSPYDR